MLWNMGVAVKVVLVVWVGWPLGRPVALTLALSRRAGEGIGTVETRVAAREGSLNRGLRGFSLMGCDAPLPFVPMVVVWACCRTGMGWI